MRGEELVDVNAQDLRKSFKDGLLKACNELCEKKVGQAGWR